MSKKSLTIKLLIIISISAILVYYFYPDIQFHYFKLSGEEEKLCSNAKNLFKYYFEEPRYSSTLFIQSNLENSLSNVCDFNVTNRFVTKINNSEVEIFSCNDTKIKNGLDNPTSLSINDIQVYHLLSSLKNINFEKNYLSEVLKRDCNIETALSVIIFEEFLTDSASSLGFSQNSFISICLSNNFTESEKKECLISLLNAEKLALNDYSKMMFGINDTACYKYNLWLKNPNQWAYKIPPLRSNLIISICQKMNDFRKDIKEKATTSNLNYLEKNALMSTLLLQDYYFKYFIDITRESDEATKQYHRILLDNMNDTLYKNMFSEFLQKYNLI
jgi:hypothetical protein